MNCHLAIASNHILGFEASKRTQAILINRKMKRREPTKRDRIRKKFIAMCKELQLYVFSQREMEEAQLHFQQSAYFPQRAPLWLMAKMTKRKSAASQSPSSIPCRVSRHFKALGTLKYTASLPENGLQE